MREARRGNPAFWALIERETGDLIGDAGVGLIEGIGPEHELGYTLGSRWWGRGYATEAARAVRDHALGPLGLADLLALVRPRTRRRSTCSRRSGWSAWEPGTPTAPSTSSTAR